MVPSSAPPTDEIDAEWGGDDIPAPAPVPNIAVKAPSTPAPAPKSSPPVAAVASPSAAPSAPSSPAPAPPRIPTPIPRPSGAPRPPSNPPIARPSTPPTPPLLVQAPSNPPTAVPTPSTAETAATAEGAAASTTVNPLRKQTLLGLAPSAPSITESPSEPASPAVAVAAAERVPLKAADNSFRKQTLLGVGPTGSAPQGDAAATPPAVASDAPSTLELTRRETASLATTRDAPSTPVQSSPASALSGDAAPSRPRSRGGLWLVAAALAAAAGIALVLGQRPDQAAPLPATKAATDPAAVTPLAAPAAVESPAEGSHEAAPAPAPSANGDAPPATSAGDIPAAAPAPAALGSASGTSGGVIRIQVESDPPGARLFWHGKAVGTCPFVLELQPGEKHAYELGMPGYVTRKVVLDGSKREISIGLRPDPASPPSPKPRK